MKIVELVFVIAGVLIVLSLVLSLYINQLWLIMTILIGLMQFIYGMTGFCPLAILLRKLGFTD